MAYVFGWPPTLIITIIYDFNYKYILILEKFNKKVKKYHFYWIFFYFVILDYNLWVIVPCFYLKIWFDQILFWANVEWFGLSVCYKYTKNFWNSFPTWSAVFLFTILAHRHNRYLTDTWTIFVKYLTDLYSICQVSNRYLNYMVRYLTDLLNNK